MLEGLDELFNISNAGWTSLLNSVGSIIDDLLSGLSNIGGAGGGGGGGGDMGKHHRRNRQSVRRFL